LPVVEVSVWAAMTKENEKKIVEGITQVSKDLGTPGEAVTVIIYEAPKIHWATDGQLHSENTPIFPVQIEQPVQECASIVDLS